MKLGVFTTVFADLKFDETLQRAKDLGFSAIELGTGAYPGAPHLQVDELLEDRGKANAVLKKVRDAGLFISALSVHGNPLHPDRAVANDHHAAFRKTVRLAQRLEVPVINAFPGCPGDSDGSKYPNWVTCSWPPDFLKILDWQWNEKAIPYWKEQAQFAESHGIHKIAFEPHPGMIVYNTETALKLREAVGETIGVNLDPSHLFWQGMDMGAVIAKLGKAGAIFHVHAKDTFIDPRNTGDNGCLDTKSYAKLADRSWTFRSVGWGQGLERWKEIASSLRLAGYDYVMSIEHEDPLMSINEGLKAALNTLRQVVLDEAPCEMWWA